MSILGGLLLGMGGRVWTRERATVILANRIMSFNQFGSGWGILNSFLESNRRELYLNKWLALEHIPGIISISGELTKKMSCAKLLTFLTMGVSEG